MVMLQCVTNQTHDKYICDMCAYTPHDFQSCAEHLDGDVGEWK
jgi:hypothetical protein